MQRQYSSEALARGREIHENFNKLVHFTPLKLFSKAETKMHIGAIKLAKNILIAGQHSFDSFTTTMTSRIKPDK